MIDHCVVLAGGLGTRIEPALGRTPKALADVGGLPFLLRKLDEIALNKCRRATLLLGHGADEIAEFLNNNSLPIEVSLVHDGATLLGTGGAVMNALDALPAAFYITYGDSLLELPYQSLAEVTMGDTADCVLAVTETVGAGDQPNTHVQQGRVLRHSKSDRTLMNAMDYGLMLVNKSALLAAAPHWKPPLDLSVILGGLAATGRLLAYSTSLPYWEIGTPSTLAAVQAKFTEVAAPPSQP